MRPLALLLENQRIRGAPAELAGAPKNIPYSLAYRLLRICSNQKIFRTRLEELRQDLLSRSYKPGIIENAFRRVLQIDRKEAIKRVVKVKQENTALVTTFHPLLPPISKIVQKHWSVMTDDSPELMKCFERPSVVSYNRHKNLRDMLVRAKLPPKRASRRTVNGYKACGELCKLCSFSPSGTITKHKCNYTGLSYDINSPINCKTQGVIYRITCNKCPLFVYIGETGRPLKQRFSEHYRDAAQKDPTKPCGKHFSLPGHSESNMSAIAIEKVLPKDDILLRKRIENYWISLYQSVIYGANTRS